MMQRPRDLLLPHANEKKFPERIASATEWLRNAANEFYHHCPEYVNAAVIP